MAVLVLDKRKKPLMPCSEKRARLLLERGRARIHRMAPFTIRLVDRLQKDSQLQPVRLKLAPGSKTTGVAWVRESDLVDTQTGEVSHKAVVLMLLELRHRGQAIRDALTRRRAFRRRRRRNLRYRAARLNNRPRADGWLAPSLQHRVDTTLAWVHRLMCLTPHCAYCGAENVPVDIDHIHPRSKGGSDRVSNLTLACHPCNQQKGNMALERFVAKRPELVRQLLAQAESPLRDAAAVNSTRWALYEKLQATGKAVAVARGGRTKYNRNRLQVPKEHCLDAACVGYVETIEDWQQPVLSITATGRGRYQRTRLTQYGFPRGYLTRRKSAFGFQTGDLLKAVVPTGKKAGNSVGRVAIRASGSFNIQTGNGLVQGIPHRCCTLIQRGDGYGYSWLTIATTKGGAGIGQAIPPRAEPRGFPRN